MSQQGVQWTQNVSTVWNKTMVKIDQANELSQLSCGGWLWKIADDFDFVLQGTYTVLADMMPQEFQFLNSKNTFGGIDHNTVVSQALENLAEVLLVLLRGRTGNQYIINVYENKVEPTKHLVHEPLECLASIPQSEGHADELI